MSTHLRSVVAGCLTASLVLVAGPATAAAPSPVSSADQLETQASFEARDLVAFFVLGAGPMMSTHHDLAADLGIDPQEVPSELVDALFDRMVAVDPDLAAAIVSLRSGDPVLVNRALERLKTAVAAVLVEDGAAVSAAPGDGRGLVWNVNHFVTTNVGAAVNLAVAVVLATAVTLAVPVALFSSAAGGGRYDQELFALKIAERL